MHVQERNRVESARLYAANMDSAWSRSEGIEADLPLNLCRDIQSDQAMIKTASSGASYDTNLYVWKDSNQLHSMHLASALC
jgi:hypothetical protein